jgi:hypothetical protein
MNLDLNHVYTRLCDKPMISAVMAALIALLAIHVAPPPRLSALDSQETCEEFEEEADPCESDGEQNLPEFVGPASSSLQRCESRLTQRFAVSVAQRGPASRTNSFPPAEIAHRNGTGGPLRC